MPDALDSDFSRSRAVLIGTWTYDHLRPVPAAQHSLDRMRDLLMSPLCGNWPENRVWVVGNHRATLGNLPHELATWFSVATDVALFYYVGHGQYDNDNRLCLSLTDSRPEAIFRTTTSLTFDAVRHAFRASQATTKIAILDCCFAGLAAGQDTLADMQIQALPSSPGFYLMMASSEFATARFQSDTENPRPQTFFTKYLVDVIDRGILGQPQGLTLGPIFDTVSDALVHDGKPEPRSRASDRATHFVFARNIAYRAPTGPTQEELAAHLDETQRKLKLAKTALENARQAAATHATTTAKLQIQLTSLRRETDTLTEELIKPDETSLRRRSSRRLLTAINKAFSETPRKPRPGSRERSINNTPRSPTCAARSGHWKTNWPRRLPARRLVRPLSARRLPWAPTTSRGPRYRRLTSP